MNFSERVGLFGRVIDDRQLRSESNWMLARRVLYVLFFARVFPYVFGSVSAWLFLVKVRG